MNKEYRKRGYLYTYKGMHYIVLTNKAIKTNRIARAMLKLFYYSNNMIDDRLIKAINDKNIVAGLRKALQKCEYTIVDMGSTKMCCVISNRSSILFEPIEDNDDVIAYKLTSIEQAQGGVL